MSLTDALMKIRRPMDNFYSRAAHHSGWDYDDFARIEDEAIDYGDIVWATHPWQTTSVLDVSERLPRGGRLWPDWDDWFADREQEKLHQRLRERDLRTLPPAGAWYGHPETRWSMAVMTAPMTYVFVLAPAVREWRYQPLIIAITSLQWCVISATVKGSVIFNFGPNPRWRG